jgi:ADP-heptose:LPS heptosyltransferase
MQAQSLDLAGRTTLGALAVLIEGARLLVCNDTEVSHIAAALKVPSVVIFIEILTEAQRRLPRIYLEHDPPREHPTDTRH